MKRWLGLGCAVVCVATVAAAEQNPPQVPGPPQSTPPLRTDSRHREMQAFAMRFGGGDESARILPPGAWWKDQELVKRIELTPDQQKKIEDFFLQSKITLIHMHASLEEEELLLGPLLEANPIDQGKALAQISKIADTRADLEKANAKMLLQVRGVLNQAQWTKLQQERPGGMRHMMLRMPDGPHSLNYGWPEMPMADWGSTDWGPTVQWGSLNGLDVEKLKSQVQAMVKAMPRIDPDKLREQLRMLPPAAPPPPVAPPEK